MSDELTTILNSHVHPETGIIKCPSIIKKLLAVLLPAMPTELCVIMGSYLTITARDFHRFLTNITGDVCQHFLVETCCVFDSLRYLNAVNRTSTTSTTGEMYHYITPNNVLLEVKTISEDFLNDMIQTGIEIHVTATKYQKVTSMGTAKQ
jgi:hypothetical protein